jgi:hypothetical protein
MLSATDNDWILPTIGNRPLVRLDVLYGRATSPVLGDGDREFEFSAR